jgi:hypothetical protein
MIRTRLLLIIFMGIACPAFSQDPCKTEIEYSVRELTPSNFSIALQSSQSIKNVHVQLFDLYQGKVVQEKTIGDVTFSKREVFTGVKASLYIIYIKYDGCSKARSLGGIEGIKIGTI